MDIRVIEDNTGIAPKGERYSAIDNDTYEGVLDGNTTHGTGSTPTEAILDLPFPAPIPTPSTALAQTLGALLSIPDSAPLPDRDELRLMAEDIVRQTTRSTSDGSNVDPERERRAAGDRRRCCRRSESVRG